MHVLTLIVSFTYSIPRFYWACVLMELLDVTVQRRSCQAVVLFREDLYDSDLVTAFAAHVSRWRHVMSDICFHYGPGFRVPPTTQESWDDDAAANDADDTDADGVALRQSFRAHMMRWELVMNQLLLIHAPSPTPILRRLHLGPIDHQALFRRRRSVPLRIALARRMTNRCVRRSLLHAFNTTP